MAGDKYKNEALLLLRQAQQRHPGDFWINYLLGQHCSKESPQAAVGYFRVAVAIRPSNDRVYRMLASALLDTGDREGAIAAERESIARNPNEKRAKDLANALTPKRGMEDVRAAWEQRLLNPTRRIINPGTAIPNCACTSEMWKRTVLAARPCSNISAT